MMVIQTLMKILNTVHFTYIEVRTNIVILGKNPAWGRHWRSCPMREQLSNLKTNTFKFGINALSLGTNIAILGTNMVIVGINTDKLGTYTVMMRKNTVKLGKITMGASNIMVQYSHILTNAVILGTNHSCFGPRLTMIRPFWGTNTSEVRPQLSFEGTTKTKTVLKPAYHKV